MNRLTVKDVINMPVMQNCRIVAGEKGLSNPVNNPNVADNIFYKEKEFTPFEVNHDFFLTTFYFGRHDPQYIVDSLKAFIKINAAAICITDEYISDIPEEAKKICDDNNFPVIFINKFTSYSSVISSIIEYKIALEKSGLLSGLLSDLTSPKISQSRKLEIIKELNPSFWNNAIVFYAVEIINDKSTKNNYIQISNNLNTHSACFASEYRDGLLHILTFRDAKKGIIDSLIEDTLSDLRHNLPDSIIGISDPCTTQRLGDAILQAFTSVYSGAEDKNNIIKYGTLGITRLLVSIQDHPALESFYNETVDPIKQHDFTYNTNLFETIISFMENDMSYSKTADAMFIHKNTIRYRMSKIRALINFGKNEIDFFETLSIIYKIYKLKD